MDGGGEGAGAVGIVGAIEEEGGVADLELLEAAWPVGTGEAVGDGGLGHGYGGLQCANGGDGEGGVGFLVFAEEGEGDGNQGRLAGFDQREVRVRGLTSAATGGWRVW